VCLVLSIYSCPSFVFLISILFTIKWKCRNLLRYSDCITTIHPCPLRHMWNDRYLLEIIKLKPVNDAFRWSNINIKFLFSKEVKCYKNTFSHYWNKKLSTTCYSTNYKNTVGMSKCDRITVTTTKTSGFLFIFNLASLLHVSVSPVPHENSNHDLSNQRNSREVCIY
jgi:hypothetical protein